MTNTDDHEFGSLKAYQTALEIAEQRKKAILHQTQFKNFSRCFDTDDLDEVGIQLRKIIFEAPRDFLNTYSQEAAELFRISGYCPSNLARVVTHHKIQNADVFLWHITAHYKKLLKTAPKFKPATEKSIAILSAHRSFISIDIAVASLLRFLGHPVTLVLKANGKDDSAPGFEWEEQLVLNELRYLKAFLAEHSIAVLITNDFQQTNDFSSAIRSHAEKQARIDIQTMLKDATLNFDQFPYKEMLDFRKNTNLSFASTFSAIAKNLNADTWIINSGAWVEYASAHAVLREMKVETICPAVRNEKGHMMFSVNASLTEMDLNAAWQRRENTPLTETEKVLVAEHVRNIEDPQFFNEKHYFQFQQVNQIEDPELAQLSTALNPLFKTILVMPNVEWDTTVLVEKPHHIFESHRAWLFETIERLRGYENVNVIVRPHPADNYFGSADFVDEMWSKKEPTPENIHILPGKSSINTYGLMKIADLGLTYTSDVGWEMVLRGRPVIGAGKGPTFDKNILFDPKSRKDYFALIDTFLTADHMPDFSDTHISNAEKYCFMYILKIQKRFPWTIGNFWNEIEDYPLDSFFHGENFEAFGDAFQILTGKRELYKGFID